MFYYYKNKVFFIFCVCIIIILLGFTNNKIKCLEVKNNHTLDSILSIDEIVSITVMNSYKKNKEYILNDKELSLIKKVLKKSKYAGGLLVKPGHISIKIKLSSKNNHKIIYGYVYKENINFDNVIDKFGNNFSGTYKFPNKIDFDKY